MKFVMFANKNIKINHQTVDKSNYFEQDKYSMHPGVAHNLHLYLQLLVIERQKVNRDSLHSVAGGHLPIQTFSMNKLLVVIFFLHLYLYLKH